MSPRFEALIPQQRRWRLAIVLLAAIFLAVLPAGRFALAHLYLNRGMLRLNHALASDVRQPLLLTEAESDLARAARLYGGDSSASYALGLARVAQGREEAALSAWRLGGGVVDVITEWGDLTRQWGQYEQAEEWYSRASRLDPDDRDLLYYWGLMQQRQGETEQAALRYQQGLTKPPAGKVGNSDLYLHLGQIAAQETPPDWRAALASYEQALANDDFGDVDGKAAAHYHAGVALRALGRTAEARAEFELAIASHPHHYWAYLELGRMAWEVDRNAEEAEARLRHALTIDGELKWAYRLLGRVYEETGHADDAAAMYEEVVERDPDDPVALKGLDRLRGNKSK